MLVASHVVLEGGLGGACGGGAGSAMADLAERGWEAEITSGPDVDVLGADAAVASFLYRVYEGEGTERDTLDWGWTLVWERRDSAWTVLQSHESMAPSGGAADPVDDPGPSQDR